MKTKTIHIKLFGLIAVMAITMAGCEDPNGDPGHIHQWDEWTQTTAPTCEEAGIKTRACTLDPSHIDTVTQTGDPALGHDWRYVEGSGTAPTCEDEGDALCSRDSRHTKHGKLPANGHHFIFEKETKPATCSAEGKELWKCTHDDTTEERAIPIDPSAHDWETLVGTAPTCLLPGNGSIKCRLCDEEEDGVLEPLDHDNGSWHIHTEATCEDDGERELRCSRVINSIACGFVLDSEVIPALEHSYLNDAYVYDENSATCTADGTETAECVRIAECGETHTRAKADTKLGHDFVTYVYNDDATCTADGTETAPCVRIAECGETHTRAKAGTKLSHDFSKWEVTTPPTFTSAGEETEKCSECGELGTQTQEVPQLLPLASIEEVTDYLAAATGGTINDPIPLKLAFDLGNMGTDPSSGWYKLYTAINSKYKCVSLDLNDCTMTTAGNAFITGANPVNSGTLAGTPARYITSIILPDTTQSIYYYAFINCTRLTSVTIPHSVESIDDGAFSNCSSLTSVTIPDSVTSIGMSAFDGCTGLTSVDIPDSVESIGNYAFNGCTGLASVTIGKGVTNIGNSVFLNCTSLVSVTIGKGVTSIGGSGAFNNCTSLAIITVDPNNPNYASQDGILYNKAKTLINHIPAKLSGSVAISDGVTSIGDRAFENRTGLTSVDIPDSVTSIGERAFGYCSGLTSVSIGSGVTTIGQSAFSGCTSLTSVDIPDSVTTIGITTGTANGAFQGCTGLASVTIGNSVTTIGYNAFRGCYGLTSVTIPDSVTRMGSSAFRDCTSLTNLSINGVTTIGDSAFYQCTGLTSVSIPSGVRKTIGNNAFEGCTGLTSVSIPSGVTYIGGSAFSGCTGLTSITIPFVGNGGSQTHFGYIFGASSYGNQNSSIPASLKTVIITDGNSIAAYAFYGCRGLASIDIPASVTTIGQQTFVNCTGLTSVTIRATTPPELGTSAFGLIVDCPPIYVPSENVTTYRNATRWSSYAASIQAIE